jgi:hypothetical protein
MKAKHEGCFIAQTGAIDNNSHTVSASVALAWHWQQVVGAIFQNMRSSLLNV